MKTFLKGAIASLALIGGMASPAFAGGHLPATVVEIAAGDENFSTLVAAVTAADLVDTLSGEGPFTVFAPTNEAFEALPEGTVEMLLKPENKDQLADVLKYHVISGKAVMGEFAGLVEVPTLQGSSLTVDAFHSFKVDGATVITPDIEAENGVVHVIDAVILPATE